MAEATADEVLGRVRLVLVRPRSPGNVGSATRAMANFGLTRLDLVALPSYDDPDFFPVESRRLAWKAAPLLDSARHHTQLGPALEGTTLALGASHRGLPGVATLSPDQAARALWREAVAGREVALVFGGEADGLRRDELSVLGGVVTIGTHPGYPELNLAQSVVVLAHELYRVAGEAPGVPPGPPAPEPAPHEEVEALADEFRELLEAAGFLRSGSATAVEELRRLLGRAAPSRREVELLRGVRHRLRRALRGRPC